MRALRHRRPKAWEDLKQKVERKPKQYTQTADAIRSLAISQRLLGTREIVLIHHTDCGMLTFQDDAFRQGIEAETGQRPEWAAEAFPDVDADVRQSIVRIKNSPFVPHRDKIRGFVYHVENGTLREIDPA